MIYDYIKDKEGLTTLFVLEYKYRHLLEPIRKFLSNELDEKSFNKLLSGDNTDLIIQCDIIPERLKKYSIFKTIAYAIPISNLIKSLEGMIKLHGHVIKECLVAILKDNDTKEDIEYFEKEIDYWLQDKFIKIQSRLEIE